MEEQGKILVIGACGQIGTELVLNLREKHGHNQVIASDIKPMPHVEDCHQLDVLDKEALRNIVEKNNVQQLYLLAALLSATAEIKQLSAWRLNMDGLFNVLDLAKEGLIKKIYWPSSIAVFGPNTPKENTPQYCVMEPSTVYGISKQAGERWCEYYHKKFGVDVRSIRYPGLIGYKSPPGGGTTDYAVHIFHEALEKGAYTSFLSENSMLPMMYMPDAIKATINLMEAPAEKVKIRSSYNIAGMSFSPKELAAEICKHLPDFKISYIPDSRQEIADSWPGSINDDYARDHWAWAPSYDLQGMCKDMLENIRAIKG